MSEITRLQQQLHHLKDTFDAAVTQKIQMDTRVYTTHIIFKLANECYAWPIANVKEIVVNRNIIPIPGKTDLLHGVINYKNRILSIMNLYHRLRLPYIKSPRQNIIILTKRLPIAIGFRVDQLITILDVFDENIKLKPISLDPYVSEIIIGETLHGNRFITIIDPFQFSF